MFRSFRPTFEKLENREVFSAGPLGLAAAAQPQGVIHPFSDFAIQTNAPPPSGKSVDGNDFLIWQRNARPADQAAPSAIWLEGTYRSNQQQAAPESQPTAITGSYNPSEGVLTLKSAAQSAPSAGYRGTTYVGSGQIAAPGSQASTIPLNVLKDNHYLKAAPGSQPTAAGDFDNDGDVDGADFLAARSANQFAPGSHIQALLGNGDGTFQPQVMHADKVNHLTAQAHDRFFEALGMASQRSMKQNYDLTLAQPWQ